MTVLYIFVSLLVGGTTGFLSGLLGIGGGFILVPLLSLIGLPIHMAAGTSLACIACIGLAGIAQHARQGSIDVLLACALALPASLMASLGVRFSSLLSPAALYLLFSLLTFTVLILFHFHDLAAIPDVLAPPPMDIMPLYVRHRGRYIAGKHYRYNVHLLKASLSGVTTGAVSGFFGVGGGFILVPLVVGMLHIPMQVTIGTSLVVVIPSALVGAITHWYLDHIHLQTWLLVTVSGIVSTQLGARFAVQLAPIRLKQLFMAVVLCGTVYMFTKGWTA